MERLNEDLWQYLGNTPKKIVLYGMGDGAEKIKSVLDDKRIGVAEIMASDEFVRGHSFLGYKVRRLSEIEELYGDDFIILTCFGSQIPEVMEHIYNVAARHELYAPCVPVAGGGLFDIEYARAHSSELQKVYKMLADEQSKRVFENVIRYKLSGKIDLMREIETPADEKFYLLEIGTEEVYVDLGAYNGDTVVEFLNETSMQFKKVYAMEPDVKNYRRMKRALYMIGSALMECYNCGAWDEDTTVTFNLRGGRSGRAVPENGEVLNPARFRAVKMMKTDTMLRGEPATYIKMDVEGSESRALEGARHTIESFKPKLNIALYHRNEDMFALPIMISEMNRKYKFYMRHHPYIPDWDTNLYCV